MNKDKFIYEIIKQALNNVTIYLPDVNIVDTYNEQKIPFITLWVGNEHRIIDNTDEASGIRVYTVKTDVSIIFVGKTKKHKNNAMNIIDKQNEVKDAVEICLNNINRNEKFYLNDDSGELKIEVVVVDIYVKDIYKTVPSEADTEYSILFETEFECKQINYFN